MMSYVYIHGNIIEAMKTKQCMTFNIIVIMPDVAWFMGQ